MIAKLLQTLLSSLMYGYSSETSLFEVLKLRTKFSEFGHKGDQVDRHTRLIDFNRHGVINNLSHYTFSKWGIELEDDCTSAMWNTLDWWSEFGYRETLEDKSKIHR